MTENLPLQELIEFRKTLHKYPELSGNESATAKRIIEFAKKYNPSEIITKIGGEGIAVIFDSANDGPTVLIRCDMDALPIEEENDFEYKSKSKNVSHKCGHDGHMTIVSGLIPLLSEEKINKGKVVLLYQPAEETGEGGERVLNDEKFEQIKPDYVFALHNLPGFKKNQLILKEKEFASASKGLIVKLKGKTSHAGEPERGLSPSLAVAELINKLSALPGEEKRIKDFSLVTIIHVKIGERAFGTTPGYAELMATLRSYKNEDMEILSNEALIIIKQTAEKYKLKYTTEWVEEFPATVNDPFCVKLLEEIAGEKNIDIHYKDEPFRWSEDFGHFTKYYKGALFGLGAGVYQPQLHNPDYDFPDDIIPTGIKVFYSLIKKILR